MMSAVQEKHHTSIYAKHKDKDAPGSKNSNPPSNNSNPPEDSSNVSVMTTATTTTLQSIHLTSKPICLLKTAVATVANESTQVDANILFDEGSQHSFVTQALIDKLQIQPHLTETIQLSAFGSTNPQVKKLNMATLQVITTTGIHVPITVLIVPSIATPLENTVKTSILTQLPYLNGLRLAHPVTRSDSFEISLLIGADHYWDLVGDHTVRGNGPTAVSSKLGYLLSGPVSAVNSLQTRSTTSLVCMVTSHKQEEKDLLNLWSVESIGISPPTSLDPDEQFLQNYSTFSISQCPDGSYMARFLWKCPHPPLPTNFNICKWRTCSLVRRLSQTPYLLSKYGEIIADQLQHGFIERVKEPNKSTSVHYIPHHAVQKNSATTPI